jgi:hypothetical protein
MEILPFLALLLILVAAAAPGLYAIRKRMSGGGGQLELWRVMHRRGLSITDAAEQPRSLALAVRRCTLCPSTEACDEWLASGARDGQEDFCPNAEYLHKLERP